MVGIKSKSKSKMRTFNTTVGGEDKKDEKAPPYKKASIEDAMPKVIEYSTEYYNAGESKIRIGSRVFIPGDVIDVRPIPKYFFQIGSVGTRKGKVKKT